MTRKGTFNGDTVYEYSGHTYGVISPDGVAVTKEPDTFPFFEVPAGSVKWDDEWDDEDERPQATP